MKCETLADIVAEMRRGTKLPGYWRSCDLNEILAYHADRIEAAWKREAVSKTETTTIGNAAAIREALENAHSLICEGIETEVDDEIEHPFHLELACEVIQRALSAPPRNCDRFATWQEAKAAFWREVGDPADWQRLLEWLYAHSHVEYK